MRDIDDIRVLLDSLEHCTADSLEDQDLDFKEWSARGGKHAMNLVVEMAVCMANGGGGVIVFGVKDDMVGR